MFAARPAASSPTRQKLLLARTKKAGGAFAPPAHEFAEPKSSGNQRFRLTISCSISSDVVIMRALAE
jgi:hypothetical protein